MATQNIPRTVCMSQGLEVWPFEHADTPQCATCKKKTGSMKLSQAPDAGPPDHELSLMASRDGFFLYTCGSHVLRFLLLCTCASSQTS
eukprot:162307-Pelagomonas_calceolata.AAC.1